MNGRIIAGKLRHRVSLLAPNGVQDSTGGMDLGQYTKLADVWASVSALSGSEALGSASEVSQVQHEIVVRYRSDINASLQVLFEGKKFQVLSVLNPDGLRKKLALRCVLINDGRQQ